VHYCICISSHCDSFSFHYGGFICFVVEVLCLFIFEDGYFKPVVFFSTLFVGAFPLLSTVLIHFICMACYVFHLSVVAMETVVV